MAVTKVPYRRRTGDAGLKTDKISGIILDKENPVSYLKTGGN
jgi:hypothetical protein